MLTDLITFGWKNGSEIVSVGELLPHVEIVLGHIQVPILELELVLKLLEGCLQFIEGFTLYEIKMADNSIPVTGLGVVSNLDHVCKLDINPGWEFVADKQIQFKTANPRLHDIELNVERVLESITVSILIGLSVIHSIHQTGWRHIVVVIVQRAEVLLVSSVLGRDEKELMTVGDFRHSSDL